MKRTLLGLLIIGTVGTSSVLLTNAYFSDTETSAQNTFTAGKLDLKVNGSDNPTAVVSFSDLKPGDTKTFEKTLFVDNNPAWVWLHLKDLVTTQGTETEPEKFEENGTPKSDLQNYLAYDLSLAGIAGLSLPDAVSCWIPLGEIPGAKDTLMTQTFNFDSAVTNWAQGDTLTFTEEFYAVQTRNNPHPSPPASTTGRVWNPDLKKCVNSQEVLIDTIQVPSTSAGPTLSNIILQSSKTYRLDITGTYQYWPSCPEFAPCEADAEFAHRPSTSYGPGWIKGESVYPPAINYALDLMVNGNNIDWGAFSAPHIYTTTLPGTGAKASFSIFDDVYSDNSGSLTVKIYELP
jgi:predicted ribosomally synthesized peptide with SipW-like signal peptide